MAEQSIQGCIHSVFWGGLADCSHSEAVTKRTDLSPFHAYRNNV
ncbi:hypothetical protein D777_01576 [Marinobacter nitratireducens]|uniref:Uncharacterized protein n=1 Tax=Marinobacter nitratireducens TaxID=1137280 RepID=A0A072NFK3_9GAMM|nr:hypothetical protein D777_01576 [Marinobacter nitratireducens]